MSRAFLAFGSNLGDRLAHLQFALDELVASDAVRVVGVSRVYETAPVGGPPQDAYLNAVVEVETTSAPHALLRLGQRIERDARRIRTERWGPRTLDVDVLLYDDVSIDDPDLVVPHPRMWERGFVLAPLRDVAPGPGRPRAGVGGGTRSGGSIACSMGEQRRTVALIGPGRAGTTVALGLLEVGWEIVAVAGRAPDAPSTNAAAACLASRPALVSEVGRGAALVVIATPDRAIEQVVGTAEPSIEPGALVVHLAGSRGLDVFDALLARRTGVRVGALHPLQSFPSATAGIERLEGAWAAVAGDPEVIEIALSLGLRPFALADSDRGRYHAAAVVASNHLVALLGQVERLAASAGVPFEAFGPLVLASVQNAFSMGPADALTGPVARGDLSTVEQHFRDLDPAERDAYRALAREAARLTGRRDTGLDRLLDDLRQHPGTEPRDE